MFATLSEPLGVAYTAVFFISGILCLLLIPRARSFDDPEIQRGLVWLLATTGAWGLLKTAFFLFPASLREPAYIIGLVAGFATVWAWLYFCSAYTNRTFHRERGLRRMGAAVFLLVVFVKLTNPIHGQYFTASEATTPFPHLAIEHGLIHWSATGLSYVLAAVGLFMIFELYVRSEYDTRPLAVLAVFLALPVVFDIIALLTPALINFIYAPIGVAIFATGVLVVFQERMAAVGTALPGGAASIYLDSEQRVKDASLAATELFPTLRQAIGDPLAEVLPEVAALLETDDAILKRGDEADRQYYFVETNPVGLADSRAQVVTFSDITRLERKRQQLRQREHELNRQNELYRAVLAASFDFVYRLDLDGQLTFVSPRVEDVLGYAPEELISKQVETMALTDEGATQARQYNDEVFSGKAIQIQDFQLEHRDGREVYADVRVVPLYEPDIPKAERTATDIIGAQGMVRETTERHRRDGLISVINRVLRHNVRNKLSVINGHAEMLTEDLNGGPKASAERIVQSADRLLDLTESARKIELFRDQSPVLESHDIIPIVEAVVSEVETQYPAASISVEGPESAVALTVPRIETALYELLDNAAKHSGEAPAINLDIAVSPVHITVTIADDGPGLPETEREVLETGSEDPLVHGSGLGLWLAYWIVTTLDGEIEILDVDRGTTVELKLPKPETEDSKPK